MAYFEHVSQANHATQEHQAMTFFANLSLNDAFHFLLQWRAAGYRARIVQLENGRWMVAKLESWTYKAL